MPKVTQEQLIAISKLDLDEFIHYSKNHRKGYIEVSEWKDATAVFVPSHCTEEIDIVKDFLGEPDKVDTKRGSCPFLRWNPDPKNLVHLYRFFLISGYKTFLAPGDPTGPEDETHEFPTDN